MRRDGFNLLALIACFAMGCSSDIPQTTQSFSAPYRTVLPHPANEALSIEFALIRQPLEEPYIASELWKEVDEQIVELEKRLILEANGFRVGTLSGTVPSDLQKLLTNKETCIDSRRITHKKDFLAVVPVERTCTLKVIQEGETILQDLDRAQCGLALQLSSGDDGELIVRCEPRVRHGYQERSLKPAKDRSGWDLRSGRPEEAYSLVAWEMSLSPQEYGVIGGLMDRPRSLGHYTFVDGEADRPVHYLLVFRAVRPRSDVNGPSPLGATAPRKGEPLPLAQQSLLLPTVPPARTSRGQSPD